MPETDPIKPQVLGDDGRFSRRMFEQLFNDSEFLPQLKHRIQGWDGRFAYRAAAKNATLKERWNSFTKGQTNYTVILRDIKGEESEGSVAHVGSFRLLVDAQSPVLGEDLKCLTSNRPKVNNEDSLSLPMHRLLVENHVYAFTWDPEFSDAYYAVKGAIAAARLASSVVSAVATVGAAAPALIDALHAAADSVHDIIRLKSAVEAGVGHLVSIKDEVLTVRDNLSETASHLGALAGQGSHSRLPGLLDMAGPLDVPVKPGKTGFLDKLRGRSGAPSAKQVGIQQRNALAAAEARYRTLYFVTVQQITPVVQVREDVEVRSASDKVISFNFKTVMADKSLLRVGETSRDQFNQMVGGDKGGAVTSRQLAELFCRPWVLKDKFMEFLRRPIDGDALPDRFARTSTSLVRWNDLGAPGWHVIKSSPSTMPMPPALLHAREQIQAKAQAKAAALLQMQHRWVHTVRGQVAGREQERLRRLNQALRAGQLPTREQFVLETTTRTGPFTNSRNNPKLLLIDSALLEWHAALKGTTSPDGVGRMRVALGTVIDACDVFIKTKQDASRKLFGHMSKRVAPVERVRALAVRVLAELP